MMDAFSTMTMAFSFFFASPWRIQGQKKEEDDKLNLYFWAWFVFLKTIREE